MRQDSSCNRVSAVGLLATGYLLNTFTGVIDAGDERALIVEMDDATLANGSSWGVVIGDQKLKAILVHICQRHDLPIDSVSVRLVVSRTQVFPRGIDGK